MLLQQMAGGAMPVGPGTNPGFARKLASSDKTTRDKAVALLTLWLTCQHDIGEEELKKIWKGLFYCVWHADKAPVQAQLIERLAGLLESVDIELSVSFFKVFLSTMRREWGGIDRLRLDKFYLLLRKFLVHVFKVLQSGGWEKEVVAKFMGALEERAFLAKDHFHGLGLNLHFTDIFWDEFRKFLPVPEGTLGFLLEPFYSVLTTTPDKLLIRRVREGIFNPLLDDGRTLVTTVREKESLDLTAGTLGYLLYSTPVASRLFELASSPSTAQVNRKVLYELNDEFSKLAKSLDLIKDALSDMNPKGHSLMNGSGLEISAKDTEGNIENQRGGSEGLSGTRLRKKKARAAVLGGKSHQICKVKKKSSRLVEGLCVLNSSSQEEPVGHGDHVGSQAQGEDDKEGMQAKVRKEKRGSKESVVATETTDIPILQKKSARKKVKKGKKAQAKLSGKQSSVLHEREVEQIETMESSSNGHQEPCAQGDSVGVQADCSANCEKDMNEVTINLEQKFDFVAAEELVKSLTDSSTGIGTVFSRETRSKKKRKREKAGQSRSEIPVGTQNGASELSTPLQPASKLDAAQVNVDDSAPSEPPKTNKRVRFALKKNLVCRPHGPLPPLSVRTPPSATPRGSALKSGVLPGPIRTRPIRMARGSSLAKSRRRASRQLLTMSLQKPKNSSRKSRNRQSL